MTTTGATLTLTSLTSPMTHAGTATPELVILVGPEAHRQLLRAPSPCSGRASLARVLRSVGLARTHQLGVAARPREADPRLPQGLSRQSPRGCPGDRPRQPPRRRGPRGNRPPNLKARQALAVEAGRPRLPQGKKLASRGVLLSRGRRRVPLVPAATRSRLPGQCRAATPRRGLPSFWASRQDSRQRS